MHASDNMYVIDAVRRAVGVMSRAHGPQENRGVVQGESGDYPLRSKAIGSDLANNESASCVEPCTRCVRTGSLDPTSVLEFQLGY
jgi:hypothetical protein